MKKLVLIMVSIVVLASCKTSKSCDAYGSRIKITSTTKHITRR